MGYINTIIILGGINIIAALGLSILTGYTGLFSIGHAGFMALGGYAAAVCYLHLHIPFIPALILGGLFAGLCSLVIGIPTFRSQLTGDYFAIATFGFAEAIRLILNNAYFLGGAFGFTGIPQLTTLPIVLGFVVVFIFLAQNFVTSQYGKNCIAIAQDELAAQMMGVNVFKTKLTSLFISAFYCGVAGGLFGFYMAYLVPSMFGGGLSSDILAAVVFGGMQSLIGPILTSFVLVAVPEVLRFLTDYRLIIYGLLFVLVMIFKPQGLFGYKEMHFGFVVRWLNRLFKRDKRDQREEGLDDER